MTDNPSQSSRGEDEKMVSESLAIAAGLPQYGNVYIGFPKAIEAFSRLMAQPLSEDKQWVQEHFSEGYKPTAAQVLRVFIDNCDTFDEMKERAEEIVSCLAMNAQPPSGNVLGEIEVALTQALFHIQYRSVDDDGMYNPAISMEHVKRWRETLQRYEAAIGKGTGE